MKVRDVNKNCLTCAPEIPHDAIKESYGPNVSFLCPDCNDRFIWGIYQTGGELERADAPPPWVPSDRARISAETQWNTAEIWWTNTGEYAIALHGRLVAGSSEVLQLSESLYECSTTSE